MSIYEGPLPQEEVDRLLANDYPLLISSRILDRLDLARRTLLDVGAGANPSLALFAHARGTQYQGMDKNPSMVEQLRTQLTSHRLPFRVDLGDVLSLDPAVHACDMVHERFVLMHLPFNDRIRAIKSCFNTARNHSIFMEYDWSPMFGSNPSPVFQSFLYAACWFAATFGVELFMGATLHTLVVNELRSSASVVQVERHQRQRADYLPELLGLCDAITGIARAKNEQPLLTMLSEIKTRLSHDRVEFVPADIVSVVTNR